MKKSLITLFVFCLVSICYAQIQKMDISSDGIELNAYLYQAKGDELKLTIIWCHGNPGGKEEGKSEFAMRLNEKGLNVLRFNYRGLWDTKGVYTPGNCQKDLKNILDFVFESNENSNYKIDTSRIIVAGYSHGSNVTIVSALHDERIKELICLGLADFSYLSREFFNPQNEAMQEFFQITKEYIWDTDIAPNYEEYFLDIMFNNYKYNFVAQAEKLIDKKMYFIIGINDVTVPIESHFFPLYRELKKINHENFKYNITGSDHGFRELFDGTLSDMIAEWIKEE